jgi:hypothetical protein
MPRPAARPRRRSRILPSLRSRPRAAPGNRHCSINAPACSRSIRGWDRSRPHLVVTVVTSLGAGARNTSNTDRTVHMGLGAVTSDLYFASAYFAISSRHPHPRAHPCPQGPRLDPRPGHDPQSHPRRPCLRAEEQGRKGPRDRSCHGPVAIVTAGAFGAALLSVSFKF